MKTGFITFEGGEGSGKSTQAKRLAAYMAEQGANVCLTREPGGTPSAERLRDLLVSGDTDAWSANAEALLMYAARDDHLRHVVRPALRHGQLVICDRFMDSTRAYQGFAGGCDPELLDQLEATIVADTRPSLSLIFDLDPEIGLRRAASRSAGHEARFENKGLAFHQKLRQGFIAIAKADERRCRLIDAAQTEDLVFAQVLKAVEAWHG